MKRGWLIIGMAALQLLVLVYMSGERELILRTGRVVYLRTAPVDPQDPFRGDYVTLDYEISRVPTNLFRDALVASKPDPALRGGHRVYAALRPDGDLASLVSLSDRQPDSGLFIRGRLDPRQRNNYAVGVRYGIEAYFVQQGRGRDLERARVQGAVQLPLEMEVALGRSGTAVLKGHRWSRLGIGLQTETATNRNERGQVETRVTAVTVLLQNASLQDLAVVDPPGGVALTLDPDTRWWTDHPWIWAGAGRAAPQPTDADVHVLKPGETHRIRVDLGDPAWFVVKAGEPPRTLTGIGQWNTRFRLVYRPPAAETCRQLAHAALIWHGFLPSRAFDGGGRVD
ncbi:MAG: GDYXXLXY domain-containing protein [Kiritimatiellaeota bacterium]|nr:GDYXXLXY domain-containing protein [Kiritimatiellota bacterium]